MIHIPSPLFQLCQKWALRGNRGMDTSVNNSDYTNGTPEVKIWLYSYEIGEGVHVEKEEDIPTDTQLKAVKRAKAEAILSEL